MRCVTSSRSEVSGHEFKLWFCFIWTVPYWQSRFQQPEASPLLQMQVLAIGDQAAGHRFPTASRTILSYPSVKPLGRMQPHPLLSFLFFNLLPSSFLPNVNIIHYFMKILCWGYGLGILTPPYCEEDQYDRPDRDPAHPVELPRATWVSLGRTNRIFFRAGGSRGRGWKQRWIEKSFLWLKRGYFNLHPERSVNQQSLQWELKVLLRGRMEGA